MKNKIILIILLFITYNSYAIKIDTIKHHHFNVLIVPDLSNRISLKCFIKPDEFVLRQFVSLLFPDIIKNNGIISEYDKYKLDFINKLQIQYYNSHTVTIDLKKFGNDQLKRLEYLGLFTKKSAFKTDTFDMVQTIRDLRTKICNGKSFGADVYDYLNNINSTQLDTKIESIPNPRHNEVILHYYDNIVILLTDGYIETERNNISNLCLSQNKVNKFRFDFLQHKKDGNIATFLNKNREKYAIKPLNNNLLKHTKIMVLQLWDRGKTNGGNIHSELPDLDIIKLIWQDWLVNSGVKAENIALYSSYETFDETSTIDVFKKFFGLK